MDLLIVLGVVLLGILLLVGEFLILPGATVLAIAGSVVTMVGIYLGYSRLGTEAGHMVLVGALLMMVITFFLGLKSLRSKKVSLAYELEGHVNEVDTTHDDGFFVGAIGEAYGDIRPVGKARIGDKIYEVYSMDGYLENGASIVVDSIEGSKIFVKAT